MLVIAAVAKSISSQLASAHRQQFDERQVDDVINPAAQIAAQWIRFIVVIAAAALNTKAPMLWSESRMLRKIRLRNPKYLRQSLSPEQPDHAFVELYVSLSKGRHRTYSRFYPLLYYLFAFSIDLIDVVELLSPRSFEPDVFSSGELTTLRLLIYFGSFATFGAVKLTLLQYAFFIPCAIAIGSMHVIMGYGIYTLSLHTRIIIGGTQLALISLFLLINLYYHVTRYFTGQTSLSHIVSVMSSTQEENFSNPDIENVNLRQNLTKAQTERLQQMELLAMEHKDYDEANASQQIPWNFFEVSDIFLFFAVSSLSAVSWGVLPKDTIPRNALMEFLEMVSVFLLYINETTTESMLFVKLLQIANISKDGNE